MKATALIDWLTFTVRDWGDDYASVIREYLQMDVDLFTQCPFGRYRYRYAVEYNNITVYFGGAEDSGGSASGLSMGVCVVMSGNGCRTFEENSGITFINLLSKLLDEYNYDNRSVNITRIDIAVDDKSGSISIGRMLDYIRKRQVNTRLRKVDEHKSYDLGNPVEDDAIGFYLGSPKSEFRYRIYDKAKQQDDYDSHWVRIELVSKSDYAIGAAEKLVKFGEERIGQTVAGMIRETLLFIENDNERVERCSVAEWWDDFLEMVTAIKFLNREKPVQSADKIYFWLEEQISRSLAMAHEIWGDDFVFGIIDKGKREMKPNQRAIVRDYIRNERMTA